MYGYKNSRLDGVEKEAAQALTVALTGYVQYHYDDQYDLRLDLKYQDYDESQQAYLLPVSTLMS